MVLPKPSNDVDEVFDALGNATRRQIVRILSMQERSVVELAQELPISRPAVSKHLKVLSKAHIVSHTQKGTRRVFRLQPEGFQQAQDWLSSFWDDALWRLKFVAENTYTEGSDS